MMARGGTWGDPGNRTEADAIRALKAHLRLLRHYRKCAFEEGDYDYLGEIACKLRLLTGTDGGRPLLLELMDRRKFDYTLPAEIAFRLIPGEPPKGNPTLRKYLNQYSAFEGFFFDGKRTRKTNAELISEWANKMGAAHEEPAPPDWLEAVFHTTTDFVWTDTPPAHVQWLQNLTDVVLHVGDQFLRSLQGDVKASESGPWERPNAAGVKVRLFLAHYVEGIVRSEYGIVSRRMYASGIGLDVIGMRRRIVGLGATIDVSYDACAIDHVLSVRLVNDHGQPVSYDPAGERPVTFTYGFKVPRPPDASWDATYTEQAAGNVVLPAMPPGRYSMRALLDGTLTDEVFFSVHPDSAPDAPQPHHSG